MAENVPNLADINLQWFCFNVYLFLRERERERETEHEQGRGREKGRHRI